MMDNLQNIELDNRGRLVLCAANQYETKYFFNKHFNKIPPSIKEDLRTICILFVQEVGGIFKMGFDEEGELFLETEAADDDFLYDEISAGLLMAEIKRTRQEMLDQLGLFYRIFILQESPEALIGELAEANDEEMDDDLSDDDLADLSDEELDAILAAELAGELADEAEGDDDDEDIDTWLAKKIQDLGE